MGFLNHGILIAMLYSEVKPYTDMNLEAESPQLPTDRTEY